MPRDRKSLYFEILVTVGLVVVPFVIQATFYFLHPDHSPGQIGSAVWQFSYKIAQDLLLLGLLWHIVRLNSESFSDFSHPFATKDLLRGFGLYVGGMILYYGAWRALWDLHGAGTESAKEPRNMEIFQAPFSVAYLLVMIVNPFLEESYVRGFLQTRLKQVGWSAAPIVLVSAGLQTSYHLYQGLLPCLLLLPFFLLFALYYQFSRRLWPIYLAHLSMDLLAMLNHAKR